MKVGLKRKRVREETGDDSRPPVAAGGEAQQPVPASSQGGADGEQHPSGLSRKERRAAFVKEYIKPAPGAGGRGGGRFREPEQLPAERFQSLYQDSAAAAPSRGRGGSGGAAGGRFGRGMGQDFSAAERPAVGLMKHPFRANFNDHFETDLTAVKDITPCLSEFRTLIRPNCPEAFSLYDPYYCNGSVVQKWNNLGFLKVIHDNRDFYRDIADGAIPPYDILVTNPPFSDDHIPKLFAFLLEKKKPFAVLMPDYVATKPWYRKLIVENFLPGGRDGFPKFSFVEEQDQDQAGGHFYSNTKAEAVPLKQGPSREEQHRMIALGLADPPSNSGGTGEARPATQGEAGKPSASPPPSLGVEPFYVIPQYRYQFEHPEGVGRVGGSHFKTMWYVWLGRRTQDVVRALQAKEPGKWVERDSTPLSTTCVHGLTALEKRLHPPAVKRPPAHSSGRGNFAGQNQHRPPQRGNGGGGNVRPHGQGGQRPSFKR